MDSPPNPAIASKGRARIVATAGMLALLIVIVRNAWVSDDAYITFRTIDNFVHGYGLRWNIDERVQSYTHPLWMFVIAAIYRLSGEPYFTSIAVSIAFSMGAVFVLVSHIATGWKAMSLALLALMFSKAFVDFSTSGLENPLTYFLLAAFFACYFGTARSPRRIGLLAFVTALLMANRPDAGLLVLPALATALWPSPRFWRPVVAGFLPLAAWEAFAVVYYGFPFPNTAYAKLATGISPGDLLAQGIEYFRDSLALDPLTLTTIGAVVVASIVLRPRQMWTVAAGIGLYFAYVLRVGGDFMSGRFFAAPLFCAAIAASRFDDALTGFSTVTIWMAIVVLGFLALPATVLSGATPPRAWIQPSGIVDERLYYYYQTGLLPTLADGSWRPAPPADAERIVRPTRRPSLILTMIGIDGFRAGRSVHIIDTLALADPLLARLPSRPRWRIGHFERDLPDGYQRSIETGVNHIVDPAISRLYDELWRVTSGPIWSRERWRALLRLNLGRQPEAADRTSPLPTLIADFTVTPGVCSISGPSAAVDCLVDASVSDSTVPMTTYAWSYLDVREANNLRMTLRLTCANTGVHALSTIPVTLTVTNSVGARATVTKRVQIGKVGACGF